MSHNGGDLNGFAGSKETMQTFPDRGFRYVAGIYEAKVCLHSSGFVAETGCTVFELSSCITSFVKRTRDLDFYYVRLYMDRKENWN